MGYRIFDHTADLGVEVTGATNLQTGEEIVFAAGNTGRAVRASCSIPGVFHPVRIGDKAYVDGGCRKTHRRALPLQILRDRRKRLQRLLQAIGDSPYGGAGSKISIR